jgi:hypothetical protein
VGWISELVVGVAKAVLVVLRGFYGSDKPQDQVVEHPEADVEVEGESDHEKLKDLGL